MRPEHGSVLPKTLLLLWVLDTCDSGAIQLDPGNIDGIIENNDLVLVNFYADWCRFSNMLAPIWDQTADKVAQEFPDKRVVIGKVDCDKEAALGGRYHITKYPTLKYIQNGVLAKKEYRGQRSVDSFVDFVKDKVRDPVKELGGPEEVASLDDKHRHIIGYFSNTDLAEYGLFKKLSSLLKEDCVFHIGIGDAYISPEAGASVFFRPSKARDTEGHQAFTGNIQDYNTFHTWAVEKCSPLVREITFENAEELTEEGLPFLILFHHPDDHDSVKAYTELVTRVNIHKK